MLLNSVTLLDVVKKNKDIVLFSNNLFQVKLIETEIAKEKNKNQPKRFWHPLIFYFY
ncbi:10501_t:CDS:1, partial [Dentiscutata heterogama]